MAVPVADRFAIVEPEHNDCSEAVGTEGIEFTVTVHVPEDTVAVVLHVPSLA